MNDLNKKYQPTTIDECYITDINKNKLNLLIQNQSFQNTIFYGNTGTGKTTIINLIINKLKISPKYIFKINLLFDKNIKTMNTDIELFSKIIIPHNEINKKIIIIENLDYISSKIQKDIAIAMNKFPNILFFIECISIINIISEIQNQSIIINFEILNKQNYFDYINKICNLENIIVDKSIINELFILSSGDIRFSLIQLSNLILISNNITIELFEHLYKIPNPKIIEQLISICINNISDTEIINICDKLTKQKYNCNELLIGMFNNLLYNNNIDEEMKNNFSEILGKYIYKCNKYIESPLQLKYCLLKLNKKLK